MWEVGTHLAYGKLASFASVGVGIIGRCKKLRQRLRVHLSSFCIADGQERVIVSCQGLTSDRKCHLIGCAGYDETGIEERVERRINREAFEIYIATRVVVESTNQINRDASTRVPLLFSLFFFKLGKKDIIATATTIRRLC